MSNCTCGLTHVADDDGKPHARQMHQRVFVLQLLFALSLSTEVQARAHVSDVEHCAKQARGDVVVDPHRVFPALEIWLRHQRMVNRLEGLSIAITVGDDVVYADAFGKGVDGQELAPNTPLFAGSVTKVLTSAALLKLVDQKRVTLDDLVSKWVPRFRPQDKGAQRIRIRHLLRHSSGLVREVPGHPYWISYVFPSDDELVTALNRTRLAFTPGSKVKYSNAAYGVVGLVIKGAAKKTAAQFVREQLSAPLRLSTTTLRPSASQRASAAPSYTSPKRFLDGERMERPRGDSAAMASAFGALTTATELARVSAFLSSTAPSPILSQRSKDWMFFGEDNDHKAPGRGLGFKREAHGEHVFASHTGWYSGYRTHIALDVARRVSVVIQATSDDAQVRPLAFSVLSYLLQMNIDKAVLLPTALKRKILPLTGGEWSGTYGVQWMADFDIIAHRGSLSFFAPKDDVDKPIASSIFPMRIFPKQNGDVAHVEKGPWAGASLNAIRDQKGRIIALDHEAYGLRFQRRPPLRCR